MRTLTPDFLAEIESGRTDAGKFLFIEPHPDFKHGFLVNGTDPAWHARLESVVGPRRIVLPFQLSDFEQAAAKEGYEICTFDDDGVFAAKQWLSSLLEPPDVAIRSNFPNTVNGLLPYQAQGYQMLKDLPAGWPRWSPGLGKTSLAAALTQHHLDKGADLVIWCVKAHNKINAARFVEMFLDIEPVIISGSPDARRRAYKATQERIRAKTKPAPILIINYEQVREDEAEFSALVDGRYLMMILDEAPMKLKNRRTKLWRAFCRMLYSSQTNRGIPYPDSAKKRPSQMHLYVTSGTPIRKGPEDFYNVIRLISPSTLGNTQEFERTYVARRDQFRQIAAWKNLDLMGLKTAHMVHQVDKHDPDIAAFFPRVLEETILIDLSDREKKLYERLAGEYRKMKKDELSALTREDILAAIGAFQMIVDDCSMVLDSALLRQKWNDEAQEYIVSERLDLSKHAGKAQLDRWIKAHPPQGSAVCLTLRELVKNDAMFQDIANETTVSKLLALQELLEDVDKAIVFNTWARRGIPKVSGWLTAWGIDHVVITGDLSQTERQAREDRFKQDAKCRVFLSSDAGSDSINLEVANLCVHYNLPFAPDVFTQRQDRAHRLTSEHEAVRFVTLQTETPIERRKREILDEKVTLQEAILSGKVAELSTQMRGMQERNDLLSILEGI